MATSFFGGAFFGGEFFNVAVEVQQPQNTGGWVYDPFPDYARIRQRIAEIQVPKRVERAIEKVAAKEVNDELEVAAEAALHRELDRLRLAYRAKYTELLRLHIAAMRARQDDDELALMLLLH